MSETNQHVSQMVGVYKKLFIVLAIITAVGIALAKVNLPIGALIIIGLLFMAFKTKVVWDSFVHLLQGPAKSFMFILLSLTIVFLCCLLILPTFNRHNDLTGTEDISKQLQEQEKPLEAHHGH